MDETKKTTEEEVNPAFEQIEGELKTRFELLPTELQQVILSSDYQTKLFELAKKHKLTYEKLGQLELETTMVLLGMTPPDEYKADIADQLALKGAALDELVGEINRDVFIPIREKLMGLYTKEEVELGEKFAGEASKEVSETKAVESPYREPILPKTPGINTGAVPTFTKNEFDSKKEMGLNPSEGAGTPIPTIKTTGTGTSAAPNVTSDPYRELPITGANTPANLTQPIPGNTTPQAAALTPDFLEKIPKLEATEVKVDGMKPGMVGLDKKLGGLQTMPTSAQHSTLGNIAPTPKTPSETLKGIAALKIALLGDIGAAKEPAKEVPIVAKEEIIVTPVAPNPPPSMPEPTPLQAPQVNAFGIPKIESSTISLNNVSQNLPGETHAAMPVRNEAETSELMRNIKLQFNENQAHQESQNRAATMQKIDSMIDFKKAGSFMGQETAVPQKPMTESQQASSVPTPDAPKFTGDFLEKNTVSGQIYDKDIDMLGGNVKKTGFFGKMKNFFGGQKPQKYEEEDMNGPMPALPKMTPQTQAPVPQKMVDVHVAQAPVSDADVDNVKIFDEVTVAKQ